MEAGYWVGVVAPAKTPAAVVAVLEKALAHVLADEDLRARLTEIGLVLTHKGSKEFGAYIVEQTKFWREFTEENKIRFD
jgi:tripartite-type tricarboxylate transporter receptor subunit TctC